jgi:ophiobolin F synthase
VLVHLQCHTDKALQIRGLLHRARKQGKCTTEQKHMLLAHMRGTRSLEFTLNLLHQLHNELGQELHILEGAFGRENHDHRLMLTLLKV